MSVLSFVDMEKRYGSAVAQQLLAEIEKAAHIKASGTDFEHRLQQAFAAQDLQSQKAA